MEGSSRRDFLRRSAALGLATTLMPGTARAGTLETPLVTFGEPYKILEIFLHGGLSAFETAWLQQGLHKHTHFDAAMQLDYAARLPGDAPASQVPGVGERFDIDHPTIPTQMGPALKPLQSKPELWRRTRVIAVQHNLKPHKAAQPFAITGARDGRIEQAGLAAAITRHRLENVGDLSAPSVVLHGGSDDIAGAAARTGNHGSRYAPLVLRTGQTEDISAELGRGPFAVQDAIRAELRDQYDILLSDPGLVRTRSPAFDAYSSSLDYLMEGLENLFAGIVLKDPLGRTRTHYETTTGITAALDLLAKPEVHYACVIDKGFRRTYDAHDGFVDDVNEHAERQGLNLWSVMHALAKNQQKILMGATKVLVLINTEFGRREEHVGTPGTEHHPRGYVNLVIGGPIEPSPSDQPVAVGHIGSDARADTDFTTVDVRAAVALAAGIQPWQADMYRDAQECGDIINAESDSYQRNLLLAEHIFGRIL